MNLFKPTSSKLIAAVLVWSVGVLAPFVTFGNTLELSNGGSAFLIFLASVALSYAIACLIVDRLPVAKKGRQAKFDVKVRLRWLQLIDLAFLAVTLGLAFLTSPTSGPATVGFDAFFYGSAMLALINMIYVSSLLRRGRPRGLTKANCIATIVLSVAFPVAVFVFFAWAWS